MEKNLRKDILNDYKLLYRQYNLSYTETCMCWGLEVPDTWLPEIDKLSKKLETLNYFLHNHGMVIEAVQVKSKYGTLRFYYDVNPIIPSYITKIESFLNKIINYIPKISNKTKNKITYFLKNRYFTKFLINYRLTNIRTNICDIVDSLIRESENKLMSICEHCGKTINTKKSPTCMTKGWIKFLCENCAIESKTEYIKNNKTYIEGKLKPKSKKK